jgi:hypothetical protein
VNSSTLHRTLQSPARSGLDAAPTHTPLMPFGVHRNKPLTDIPSDYLLWLGCLDDLRQPLLSHVLQEMGRRIVELEQHAATADKVTP